MSNYTPSGAPATSAAKNSAPIRAEFVLIQTAVNSKVDTSGALGTPTSGVLTNCTGTASGLTAGATTNVTSGTYSPTLTNGFNITSSSTRQCQYLRVGSVVSVSGAIDVNSLASGNLGVSLPIASNLGTVSDLGGMGGSTSTPSTAVIVADTANDRATFTIGAATSGSETLRFQFQYLVI